MSDDERRGEGRIRAEIKVDYRTVGSFITDYSANISKGGMFVETSLPLAVNERVRLRVTLPGDDLPFALDGIVRWCRRPEDDETVTPGMGVEFVDFDDALKTRLEKYVDSLDAAD